MEKFINMKKYTEEEKDIMISKGEYCGICGKTADTEKEYKEMEKNYWYCSKKCREQVNEENKLIQ